MRNVVSGLKSASLFFFNSQLLPSNPWHQLFLVDPERENQSESTQKRIPRFREAKSRSDGGWNTHRKPVGALLSHCAVAPRITLWTQTAASLPSVLQGLKTHLSGAATLLYLLAV